jgi:hypothetical protein
MDDITAMQGNGNIKRSNRSYENVTKTKYCERQIKTTFVKEFRSHASFCSVHSLLSSYPLSGNVNNKTYEATILFVVLHLYECRSLILTEEHR